MRKPKGKIMTMICILLLLMNGFTLSAYGKERVRDCHVTKDVTLLEEVLVKLQLLRELKDVAEQEGYDVEREKAAIWMAEQFLKFADWDEAHIEENAAAFGSAPMYKNSDTQKMAEELPDFERREVLKMVEKSLLDLQQVMAGAVSREPVRLVEWDKVTVQNGQYVNSDGKPVFLYDYFSKAHGAPQNDPELYNDYLGNIVHPLSLSTLMCATEEGDLNDRAINEVIHFDTYYPGAGDNIGYMFLWHKGNLIPKWAQEKYGIENLNQGISTYTSYDIDNPYIRDMWTKIFDKLIPQIAGRKQDTLGYVLTNEPHWVTDQNNKWFAVKNGISDHTLAYYRTWLQEKHGDIATLNQLWGTAYNAFDDITVEVPMDIPAIRGTPMGYDWQRFNMDRVMNWFTFLHDGILENDSTATTHFKIFPRFITGESGYRDHGIDVEAISMMTEMVGHDATIRKANNLAVEPEAWETNYVYYWREAAMMNDLLSSFGPDKININSESHFASTSNYRDLEMAPEYVRSTYWLSTITGTHANLTWWWPRYADGSIEPRHLNNLSKAKSYPGSVVQQPRVANEITQTFFDMNAHSETLVKFQQQEKPIRLFYSETANIQDKEQINKLFDVYESMYFEGMPMGFATQRILDEEVGAFDVVVIYDTPTVTDAEFEAVQNYLNAGGTVIIDEVSLVADEYTKERHEQLIAGNGQLVVVEQNTLENMKAEAFKMVQHKMPTVIVKEDNGLAQKGCIWRVVDGDDEDNKVVTVINVGKNTAQLTIEDIKRNNTKVIDLLTGQALSHKIQLPPEGVLLLNVGNKSAWATHDPVKGLEEPITAVVTVGDSTIMSWIGGENEKYHVYANDQLIASNIHATTIKLSGMLPEEGVDFVVKSAKGKPVAATLTKPYKVVKGDTLAKIAKRYHTTLHVLQQINDIKNPHYIHVNQIILVPTQ